MKKIIKWVDDHPMHAALAVLTGCIFVFISSMIKDWKILCFLFAIPAIIGIVIWLLIMILTLREFFASFKKRIIKWYET